MRGPRVQSSPRSPHFPRKMSDSACRPRSIPSVDTQTDTLTGHDPPESAENGIVWEHMVGRFGYLSVLFIQREGFWVAQSLEYDLAAQGRTVDEAKHAFEQTLIGQIMLDKQQGRPPLDHLPPAPDRYWDAFRQVAAQFLKT